MASTNGTSQRFTLDEARVSEWLRQAAEAYEDGAMPGYDGAENLPDGITADWEPCEVGEEPTVYHLVRNAVDAGIIGVPNDNYDVDFEYVADEDGGSYYFLVRVGQLKLASFAYEMRKIDGGREHGATAALAILKEAVRSANGVLSDLDEYVASRR